MINKLNIQIISLIIFVFVILIINTTYNNFTFKESEIFIQKRDTINSILTKLGELSYQSIYINDIENEFFINPTDTLNNRILELKKQEFNLIRDISTALIQNGIINQYNQDLVIIDKLELDFNDNFKNNGTLKNWITKNQHKTLIINAAIRNIEKLLYDKRNDYLILSKSILKKINISDIIQTILTIILTIIIVIILYKDNIKYKKLASDYKKLNLTKDKFFSIISHDLKNPFSSILGFSDLILKNKEKYPLEKIIKFVDNINNSSRLTYELLENLLEWSRIQKGEFKPKFQTTKLDSIIIDIIELLKHNANQKYITVTTEINSNSQILADKEMIKTVLRNLVTNAIKFTDINGSIMIKTTENSKFIDISIEDSGVGMDNKMVENLFKLETKNSKVGTNGERGTGLGLLLCKELTELNNGKISVESEIDKGTKITISLPINL